VKLRWLTHEGTGKAVLKGNVINSDVVENKRIVDMGHLINNAQSGKTAEWMMQSQ
jgi:hypothetical protein